VILINRLLKGLALLLCVISLPLGQVLFAGGAAILLGISFVMDLFIRRSGDKAEPSLLSGSAAAQSEGGENAAKETLLVKELAETRQQARELTEERDLLREERELLLHSYRLIEVFLPRAAKMADIIFQKGEASSLVTSRHIHQIGQTSRQVGSSIQETLGQMLEGDDNLHSYVDELMDQTHLLAETDDTFKLMGRQLMSDMEKSREAVGEILSFSQMIADLADRTNILAINASIEAARVGNAGRGFSVIAGEVQKLSRNSFDLSEKIQGMSRDITGMMENTFAGQERVVNQAVDALDGVRKRLESVSGRLHDRVHDVGESIDESRKMSEMVIDQISRITVVLQSQDINRQVLEHILILLNKGLEAGRPGIEKGEALTDEVRAALEDELKEMARGILSVDEEFQAMEMEQVKRLIGSRASDLQGDIELF